MRGLMAGGTDYSHQSLTDIHGDLTELAASFCEWSGELTRYVKELEAAGRWGEVPFDFRAQVAKALKLLDTACAEMKDIGRGILHEVQSHHTTRLHQLSKSADEVNRGIGQVWNADYMERWKEDHRGEDWFPTLERLYSEGRDSVATLLDLDGMSVRLAQFTGRKPTPSRSQRALGFLKEHVFGVLLAAILTLVVSYLLYRLGWG